MAFPAEPSDGDLHRENGQLYRYDDDKGRWVLTRENFEHPANIVVADSTARDALEGLIRGQMVSVVDGPEAWIILEAGDGTWANATKMQLAEAE